AAVAPPAGRDPPRPVAIAPARRCRRPAVGGAGQRPPEASGPPRAAPEDLAAITLFSYYVIIMAILNLTERTSGFSEGFRGFSGFLACVACPPHGRLVFRIGASAAPKVNAPRGSANYPLAPPPCGAPPEDLDCSMPAPGAPSTAPPPPTPLALLRRKLYRRPRPRR